ncbi:hypothetical protein BCR44DRAFT_43508 [Catenaria anguillulae PL171]|uniref:Pentatricopeptide repeat-containing protein-mitochondrial domain-containing protein n=1 Tax=Catenaria anguillulae PL171 TaxID=765915 RepID=A0A1Y2HU09_9FUNG|nr:hypothetical protein BCR44DRAFT_43508 [Catenaria anguillulae PL171]
MADAAEKDKERCRHYLSWEILGLLLRKLVAAHRRANVAEVFADLRVGLVQEKPVVWWAELVRLFAQANYTEHAKQAFTRLIQLAPPRPTPVAAAHTSTLDEGTLTAMLDLAARSADPILAAHVLKVMTSFHITPTESHFCSLVLAFGRARDFKSVIYVLSLMRKAGFNPHNAAHSVLQPMLNLPLDVAVAAAKSDATSSADYIDVPPNLQRPIATVTQWRAAALLLPVLKEQARFAIDAAAMAMLINNARILQIDDMGLDLYRRREALQVPLDLELAHAALACCRGSASGNREQVLADMQQARLEFNDRTYELLIRLTLGDLVTKRTEALMDTVKIRTLEHLEGQLEHYDDMYTDHDKTYPAQVAFANFDASPWLDRAVGYLDKARDGGCINSRQCVLLLRNLARFGDVRWRQVASEIVQRGYFVDARTTDKLVDRYPDEDVVRQLARLAMARVRRPQESGTG